jgi:hypothetical protein
MHADGNTKILHGEVIATRILHVSIEVWHGTSLIVRTLITQSYPPLQLGRTDLKGTHTVSIDKSVKKTLLPTCLKSTSLCVCLILNPNKAVNPANHDE